MATFLPDKRGFSGYASRFLDDALGFMTGWNYIFKYFITCPNQVVASVVTIQYWNKEINAAVWCTIMIIIIMFINIVRVRLFGEVEFWMRTCKGRQSIIIDPITIHELKDVDDIIAVLPLVLVLTMLIILGIVLDLGGGPNGDRLGFRHWKNPGPFSHCIYENKTGVFLGVWYAFRGYRLSYPCVGSEPRETKENADPYYRLL